MLVRAWQAAADCCARHLIVVNVPISQQDNLRVLFEGGGAAQGEDGGGGAQGVGVWWGGGGVCTRGGRGVRAWCAAAVRCCTTHLIVVKVPVPHTNRGGGVGGENDARGYLALT